MSLVDGSLPALARAVLALAAVLLLLLAARWTMARQGFALSPAVPAADALRVVASLSLDARNRIVVVRYGPTELMLAVGPAGIARLDASPQEGTAIAGSRERAA